jgi:hypothetical protein
MEELSNFQNIQLDVGDASHFFMAKYSDEGVVQWARGYGLISPLARGFGIDLDADNNLFLSSTTIDFSVFDTIPVDATGGLGTFFLARFNDEGDIAWIDLVKNKGVESSRLVVNRPLNQIYVTGYFSDPSVTFGDFTLTATVYPGRTFFITKYSSNKTVLWAKANGGDVSRVRGKSIDISQDGSVFICGDYGEASLAGVGVVFGEGANALTLKKKGTYDGFVVKYKPDGEVDWANAFAGPEHDDAKAVCAISNEIAVVTGVFTDSIYIGDTAFYSKPFGYSGNFYLASCNGMAAPSEIFYRHPEKPAVTAYPNPSPGFIVFTFENEVTKPITVSVFSMNGRLLKRKQLNTPDEWLNVAELKPGIYLAVITDEQTAVLGTVKIVVQ